ncbi:MULTISPECIES: 50S ribosomal protein L18 [Dictyoglomus]|jgi:large subunit ribosomal protein L18|uniref:Large ribosomal subunit protein uL18 n=1 Tax=Dictyoglomus turgidum (strain DSM 6724 / Z-1310) TaxID=515635 RepID=RL18_DICTD|nr:MULTISPECIES: 50S ribosomal protein L18 [Dictyoglomus]B8E1E9.1 RecName: Full=Large ribosomal subunit protein uL18; AltName: Full=50S ribosomal protein L18 [Dictyoglomus turgidum DSM 6724]ACK42277.1 ribosomal protein L18 [Dictyoglomus turgidum DSM 6724]PNV80592.1 MAG: 50S ribosomal protein L18 [Dictyoglomus turgidum]HBU31956.1 50S ribosomal protein L18 [Dictyoglomus sp.]
MIIKRSRKELRRIRHLRIRKKITGTPERPRLAVYKSLRYIYAQIIDDTKGHTLVAASSLEKELRSQLKSTKNIEAAKLVGEVIAKRALEKGIKRVVFDRGGFLYHGKVKALADSARAAGLEF